MTPSSEIGDVHKELVKLSYFLDFIHFQKEASQDRPELFKASSLNQDSVA
jgi:hypothetical protein